MNQGHYRVKARDINERNVRQYVNLLNQHFDRAFFSPGKMSTSRDIPVIDEEFAASLISALSKSASSFMIASHFVSLTENLLMRTMQMSLSYRPLAIALLLQLFQVAGKSITDARKGRLRLQIAKLAIECKLCDVACDCDPREQLQEAAKYAKKCIRDANDSTLWNEVCAVAQTHGIHATWLDC